MTFRCQTRTLLGNSGPSRPAGAELQKSVSGPTQSQTPHTGVVSHHQSGARGRGLAQAPSQAVGAMSGHVVRAGFHSWPAFRIHFALFSQILSLFWWAHLGRGGADVSCREEQYRSGSLCCQNCPAGEPGAAGAPPMQLRRCSSAASAPPLCFARHVCDGGVHGGGAAGDVSGMRRRDVHGARQRPAAVLPLHAVPPR